MAPSAVHFPTPGRNLAPPQSKRCAANASQFDARITKLDSRAPKNRSFSVFPFLAISDFEGPGCDALPAACLPDQRIGPHQFRSAAALFQLRAARPQPLPTLAQMNISPNEDTTWRLRSLSGSRLALRVFLHAAKCSASSDAKSKSRPSAIQAVCRQRQSI